MTVTVDDDDLELLNEFWGLSAGLNVDAAYSGNEEVWADYQASLARIKALRSELEGKGLLAPRSTWAYIYML